MSDGKVKNIRIQKILRYEGLTPQPIEEAGPGSRDIRNLKLQFLS